MSGEEGEPVDPRQEGFDPDFTTQVPETTQAPDQVQIPDPVPDHESLSPW